MSKKLCSFTPDSHWETIKNNKYSYEKTKFSICLRPHPWIDRL